MKLIRYLFARFAVRTWTGSRVRECLDVLPIVRRQLQETSRQVEASVVGVCESFTGIAARAREAVGESARLLEGQSSSGDATVESSIETSRRTIATLLERMERAAQLSSVAVSSMEEVSRTVNGIEELLGQVQRIAFTNKLVALNAKIEAVHVGELGSGFEVVADEISRQAETSTLLAGQIEEHIKQMRNRVDSSAQDLRQFLAEDRQTLDQSREEADGALSMLLSLHGRTRDSLQRTTEENSRLAGEIAAAVVGLQFQDRVKQQVEHVVEALQRVENVLAGNPRTHSPATGAGAGSDLLAAVQSLYTMASEREAHGETAAEVSLQPQEMDVELF